MTYEAIISQLKSKGFKLTTNRQIIVQVLVSHIDVLLTAEEILGHVLEQTEKINRSTIYRNIETLLELNLLYRSINKDGVARYKIICSPHHHHHLICDICGKIAIYDVCNESAFNSFANSKGFILTGHKLELHGICETCQRTL